MSDTLNIMKRPLLALITVPALALSLVSCGDSVPTAQELVGVETACRYVGDDDDPTFDHDSLEVSQAGWEPCAQVEVLEEVASGPSYYSDDPRFNEGGGIYELFKDQAGIGGGSTDSTSTSTSTTSTPSEDVVSEPDTLRVAYSDEPAPWNPGTVYGISTHNRSNTSWCSSAFSFVDYSGNYDRFYAVTSGHCVEDGDMIYQLDEYDEPVGTPVGKTIWSSFTDGANRSQSGVYDWAIIEITDPDAYMERTTDPEEVGNIVALEQVPEGKIWGAGGTTGLSEGRTIDNSDTVTNDMGDGRVSKAMWVDLCQRPGDSGGSVFTEVGGEYVTFGVTSFGPLGAGEPCQSPDYDGITPTWVLMDQLMDMFPNSSLKAATIEIN